MRVCVVCVLRVRLATVQQQSRSKVVWTTSMRVLTLHVYINMHMYDMCAMICDGCVVAYATTTIYCCTSIIMFKVNNSAQQERSYPAEYYQVLVSLARFPPTYAVTAVIPACPCSSTCVTPGISRHTYLEGEPCNIYLSLHIYHGVPLGALPSGYNIRRLCVCPLEKMCVMSLALRILEPTIFFPQIMPDEHPPTPPALITLPILAKFQLVWRLLCDAALFPCCLVDHTLRPSLYYLEVGPCSTRPKRVPSHILEPRSYPGRGKMPFRRPGTRVPVFLPGTRVPGICV